MTSCLNIDKEIVEKCCESLLIIFRSLDNLEVSLAGQRLSLDVVYLN